MGLKDCESLKQWEANPRATEQNKTILFPATQALSLHTQRRNPSESEMQPVTRNPQSKV
jgi:hypothetical protein